MDSPERFTHQVDQYDAWQRETIRTHGWALQAVLGDEEGPPFVYTVGLSGFAHPELVLFATVAGHRGAGAQRSRRAGAPRAGAGCGRDRGRAQRRVHLLAFPDSADWLFAANDLYRMPGTPPVPALLVVPDDELVPEPGGDGPCRCCAG